MSDLTSNANLYNQEALNVADSDINEIKILQRKLTPFEPLRPRIWHLLRLVHS